MKFPLVRRSKVERQNSYQMSLEEYASWFSYLGIGYPLQFAETLRGNQERVDRTFQGYVWGAYRGNGVVHACMGTRLRVFSEARFQFRQMRAGRPGDLFGTQDLQLLETPWPNGTTGDLLARAIQDADLAGNAFFAKRPGGMLARLRPDWVVIVLGSDSGEEVDARPVGYTYTPGGPSSGEEPLTFDVSEVAHFYPTPDPLARYRGMSWITPVLREIDADIGATTHKLKFFENGGTPNMIVKMDPQVPEDLAKRWIAMFKDQHEGSLNAYKTLFLGGGADATVVGANFQQMDFKVTQGAGETRIAAAAGVPPILVGLSEGLASATYSNYGQARRAFADMCMRPLWRNISGSLAPLVNVPNSAELWYDDRDVPFLHEDALDATTIRQTQAASIKILIDAGFDATSCVEAVISGDMSRLIHTGLTSVQLRPPLPEAQQPATLSQALPPMAGQGNGQVVAPAVGAQP